MVGHLEGELRETPCAMTYGEVDNAHHADLSAPVAV